MVGLGQLPTRHKSPHLTWGKRWLQHKGVSVVICHIFIHHHLLWRRDPICQLVLSKTNSDGRISSGGTLRPLSVDLLRGIILVYAHLWVVRSCGHNLAVASTLLHAARGLWLVDESSGISWLVLWAKWLCWRRHHHHLLVIHLGREIFFSILLEMISARYHSVLRIELATTYRRSCVWQLLMMLVQEGLVSILLLLLMLLLMTIHAVCGCQGCTCEVHLRLEVIVLGHH